MKKISLTDLDLNVNEFLSREQLKTLLGGNDDYTADAEGAKCVARGQHCNHHPTSKKCCAGLKCESSEYSKCR